MFELPYCNSDMFQLFLNELAMQNKNEFKIIILDNGYFHHARTLPIADNIALLFLPTYSPELNHAERVWHFIKQELAMHAFKSLEEINQRLSHIIQKKLTTDRIISLCSNQLYIKNYNSIFNV